MKSQLKSAVIILFGIAVLMLSAIGCKNTAHGFGQDVEKTGEKIQEKTE